MSHYIIIVYSFDEAGSINLFIENFSNNISQFEKSFKIIKKWNNKYRA